MDFSNIEPVVMESCSPRTDESKPIGSDTDSQGADHIEPDMMELNTPMVELNTPNVEHVSELNTPNIEPIDLRAALNTSNDHVELEAPFHSTTVLTELQTLQREQILCDVRLTTDTGGVSAHKVVLMATSPSMRLRLATGDRSNELIHFDNIPLSLLETVVKFMYTGKLNFESSCIDQLLKFCEDLELSCAVNLLKDYTRSDGASDTSEGAETEDFFNKSVSDTKNKSLSTKGIQTESKDSTKRSDKDVSSTKNKKTNRRVKQTPKKRTAKNPVVELQDIADTAPDKLLKLSSDILIQKVIEQGIIKEEPQSQPVEYRGRGRPKKNSLRAPKKVKKATKRKAVAKPKYVSKKVKKEEENVEYDEDGEKIYNFTQITPERSKTSRREVNALKSVISSNAKTETKIASPPYSEMSPVKELKTEKLSDDEHSQDFGGDTETEQGWADSVEDTKPKKKRIWKKRKKQPCSMCDKVLSTKKRLVFHLFCQHGIDYDRTKYKMYHCPVEGCGHVSSSTNNLRTHTRSRHAEDRPHICEFCGKSFKLQGVLATHLNLHTGAKVFECKKCGERFNQHAGLDGCGHVSSSRNNLRTHTRSRHSEDRPHICEFCGKSFKLNSGLATHLNVHTGAKVFECKKCGERFNQHSGLDVHIKRYHMGESSFSELCHLCSEKFLQKSDLSWHLFRVHDQPLPDKYKAYTCDKCDFVSKSVQDFERHKNAHAGIKEWVCNICSKGCATKSELKRHIMYHGEKKFKCTYENCSYACVDDIGLQKHIQLNHTHKHFKPYVCSVCKYKTGVKGNLDKHIRQVHNLEVVSKHTVPLKMKYKDFQQGDIITKDMQLVISVQEREKLYKEELALLQCSQAEHGEFKDNEDTRIKQITKTRKSAAERKKPTRSSQSLDDLTMSGTASTSASANESADASAHLESEFGVPLSQADKYKNQTNSQPTSFQADMNAPLFGSHVFSHNQSIPPHMALGLGAHDLRMGLAAHIAGSHLYPEELQAFADAAMEHVAMNK